jgi:hypothetical protein
MRLQLFLMFLLARRVMHVSLPHFAPRCSLAHSREDGEDVGCSLLLLYLALQALQHRQSTLLKCVQLEGLLQYDHQHRYRVDAPNRDETSQ